MFSCGATSGARLGIKALHAASRMGPEGIGFRLSRIGRVLFAFVTVFAAHFF